MGASRTIVAACCIALSAAAAPVQASDRATEGVGSMTATHVSWPTVDGQRARLSAERQEATGGSPAAGSTSTAAGRRARLALELATPLVPHGPWELSLSGASEQWGAAPIAAPMGDLSSAALQTAEAWVEGPIGPAWLAVGVARERWAGAGQARQRTLRTWGELSTDDRWSEGRWLAALDHQQDAGVARPLTRLDLGWQRGAGAGHGLGLSWSRPLGPAQMSSEWRVTYRLALP